MPVEEFKILSKEDRLIKRLPSESSVPQVIRNKLPDLNDVLNIQNQDKLTKSPKNLEGNLQPSPVLISLYLEFKKVVSKCDESIRKKLTPLMVNVLECINTAYQVNRDFNFRIQLLETDNHQLIQQCTKLQNAEREYYDYKIHIQKELKDMLNKLEVYRNNAYLFEMRHKNILEYSRGLEEQSRQMRKEHNILQQKYVKLFRHYVVCTEKSELPDILEEDLYIVKQLFERKTKENKQTPNKPTKPAIITRAEVHRENTDEKYNVMISKLKKQITELQGEIKKYKYKLNAQRNEMDYRTRRIYYKADVARYFIVRKRFYVGLEEPVEWTSIIDPSAWVVENFTNYSNVIAIPKRLCN
ncbi:unnamed protein product [Phyllotreta striolata]|uniref:Uncharacterized protein n=1 Tax=Phyllotreta striolata TaxID=444603 RepID=A0A9N9XP77_PHYSR|nr:unnamed protein product [Phyllotreta striolata]